VKVGTRELKNRLSYYLRRVREADESIYVTDRGEVVAELKAARRRSNALEQQPPSGSGHPERAWHVPTIPAHDLHLRRRNERA